MKLLAATDLDDNTREAKTRIDGIFLVVRKAGCKKIRLHRYPVGGAASEQ